MRIRILTRLCLLQSLSNISLEYPKQFLHIILYQVEELLFLLNLNSLLHSEDLQKISPLLNSRGSLSHPQDCLFLVALMFLVILMAALDRQQGGGDHLSLQYSLILQNCKYFPTLIPRLYHQENFLSQLEDRQHRVIWTPFRPALSLSSMIWACQRVAFGTTRPYCPMLDSIIVALVIIQ
jgi:hypothetical protein